MFPKAHAAAYVLMAVRIAYFKVHHPLLYYAAYFTVRADDFDIETMIKGSTAIKAVMDDINSKGLDASPKEKSLLTVLELALEMCERGFSFQKVDLYRSSASEFIIDGNSLIPPFNSIPGLGTNAALNIVKAREEGEFLSKEDLQKEARCQKRSWNTWSATAVSSRSQIRTSCLYFKGCRLIRQSLFCFLTQRVLRRFRGAYSAESLSD